MTNSVLMETANHAHSLTHSF